MSNNELSNEQVRELYDVVLKAGKLSDELINIAYSLNRLVDRVVELKFQPGDKYDEIMAKFKYLIDMHGANINLNEKTETFDPEEVKWQPREV